MKTLAYISFAIAVLGVWAIFHGGPITGSATFITGAVLGVIFWQAAERRRNKPVAHVSPPMTDEAHRGSASPDPTLRGVTVRDDDAARRARARQGF
jgi:hypothetical protein